MTNCWYVSAEMSPSSLYSKTSVKLKMKAQKAKNQVASCAEWGNLSYKDKKTAVERYFAELSQIMQISNYSLEITSMKETPNEQIFGRTKETERKILINVRYIDSYEVLSTVTHECYHAYQNNVIGDYKSDGGVYDESSYVINLWDSSSKYLKNLNFQGLTDSQYDYLYRNSIYERTARWFEK